MATKKVLLAELLLRRKQLQDKVEQLKAITPAQIFETVVQRRQVNETVDDITARVPKLTASQVTQEYDYYAEQLRLCDASIQQANWTTQIEMSQDVMKNYIPPTE